MSRHKHEEQIRKTLTQPQELICQQRFLAAVRAGALACGRDPDTWDELGDCLGLAYQAADDRNAVSSNPSSVSSAYWSRIM